jgi:hypothetical protein
VKNGEVAWGSGMILGAVPLVEAHLVLTLLHRLTESLVRGDSHGWLTSAQMMEMTVAPEVPQLGRAALDDWRRLALSATGSVLF